MRACVRVCVFVCVWSRARARVCVCGRVNSCVQTNKWVYLNISFRVYLCFAYLFFVVVCFVLFVLVYACVRACV